MTVANGAERFDAKRRAGISTLRKDGSSYSAETDIQAAAAEKFAADMLGCPYNAEVYPDHGDPGHDFTIELTVEVYHPGLELGRPGHLIIPLTERHADIYIVIGGNTQTGFYPIGWTTHHALTRKPQKDFGYGMRYACRFGDLWPIEKLMSLRKTSPAA